MLTVLFFEAPNFVCILHDHIFVVFAVGVVFYCCFFPEVISDEIVPIRNNKDEDITELRKLLQVMLLK